MICIIIETLLIIANVIPTCEYDLPNDIAGFLPLYTDVITNFVSCRTWKIIHLPGWHGFYGAFDFLKNQTGSHIWKQNFQISCAKTSLTSKVILQYNFLD